MAQGQLGALVGYLRRIVRPTEPGALTDRDLLERFAVAQDELAFAEVVRRHGPMVLSVGRRVLNDSHAAEDVFQATFLVLARRAAGLRWRASVASWLYQVAYRIALRTRTNACRRHHHERQAAKMPRAETDSDARWEEVRGVLDQELTRLPEKYRAPLLLCYLEGKTNEEAAQQLGWTKGTVSGRLARARDLLRVRLLRRGLGLSVGGLTMLLSGRTVEASLSSGLLETTVTAAARFASTGSAAGVASAETVALAQGVLNAMLFTKLKWTAGGLLVVALLAGGIGLLGRPAPQARAFHVDQPEPPKEPARAPEKPAVPIPLEPLDYINRVHVQFSEQQRFGLVCPRLRDPRNPDRPKLLTRDERGITNNTCVRIEGYEYLFGVEIPGVRFVKENGKLMKEAPIPNKDRDRAWQSVWESDFGKVRITQSVEIIIGEQSRLYDTTLVRYRVENRDQQDRTVGLRVLLDTFVGGNDGLPFYAAPAERDAAEETERAQRPPITPARIAALIQGQDSEQFEVRQTAYAELEKYLDVAEPALRKALEGKPSPELKQRVESLLGKVPQRSGQLVSTMKTFSRKDMPAFVRAVEGLGAGDAVVQLGLKVRGCEPLEKFVICRWPQNSEARWGGGNGPGDWPYEPMDKNPNAKDSCAVLYWAQAKMKAGEQRELAFTYGLGRVVGDAQGKESVKAGKGQLGLFASPGAIPDKPFTVTAYVQGAEGRPQVTLKLPEGLSLAAGERAEQMISPAVRDGLAQVTWRVKAAKPGKYILQADAADIGTSREAVEVRERSLWE